ncbi:MAG: glycosyltransferase family 4 protein [Rhodobacteraceae bacterium]|nr:glycosyltransferase family 4 protein [Paracoccaceae bacterium]
MTLDELRESRPLKGLRTLIVVENLPVPFDRRVWMEATTLAAAGATVSVICPKGAGFDDSIWEGEGVKVYRHSLPLDASGALGYLLEYGAALFWETVLTIRIALTRGIDVIHGCNPPDLIFLVALPFKVFGVRYLFDHHDINPELYEAKFGKRGFFWKLMSAFEWLTFKSANVSIATNDSYWDIAIGRGGMAPENVFIVRSGPDLTRLIIQPDTPKWRNGRKYMVGYVGVMGDQEGIDLLLETVTHLVKTKGRDDIQFCLVGGGPSLISLKKQCNDAGLDDFVTFTGRVPDQALFQVLSTATICINPDRVNEMNDKSTMNKILEYMAFGKPIVQFDVVEGRYSAQHASLYAKANDPIDFADKIEILLDDPEKCAEMGRFGRHRVETEMAWPYQVPKLIEAYQKILSKKQKGRIGGK